MISHLLLNLTDESQNLDNKQKKSLASKIIPGMKNRDALNTIRTLSSASVADPPACHFDADPDPTWIRIRASK
jgi:hypothetical protein